jgi:hypothetical protein
MKAYRAVVGRQWSTSRPGRFTPGERATGTHWIEGWMGPRSGLDDVEEILNPTETRTPTPRSVQHVAGHYPDLT